MENYLRLKKLKGVQYAWNKGFKAESNESLGYESILSDTGLMVLRKKNLGQEESVIIES